MKSLMLQMPCWW